MTYSTVSLIAKAVGDRDEKVYSDIVKLLENEFPNTKTTIQRGSGVVVFVSPDRDTARSLMKFIEKNVKKIQCERIIYKYGDRSVSVNVADLASACEILDRDF